MNMRVVILSSLLTLAVSAAIGAQPATPSWQVFADCSAAYQANWLDRLNDPNRTHEMANMIQGESHDYEKAASRAYVSEKKAAPHAALKEVRTYVKERVNHFVAMDKSNKLEGYIDNCPQIDIDEN
jgi:hypothetical protein